VIRCLALSGNEWSRAVDHRQVAKMNRITKIFLGLLLAGLVGCAITKGAAVGAGIGALAGDTGKGAAIGASVGSVVGMIN